jgi:uncharacterized protein GlcG (DUF336 family)
VQVLAAAVHLQQFQQWAVVLAVIAVAGLALAAQVADEAEMVAQQH